MAKRAYYVRNTDGYVIYGALLPDDIATLFGDVYIRIVSEGDWLFWRCCINRNGKRLYISAYTLSLPRLPALLGAVLRAQYQNGAPKINRLFGNAEIDVLRKRYISLTGYAA